MTLLALTATPLGSCTSPEGFAPSCPKLALPADAAQLLRFTGSGRDITDLVLQAQIAAVPASCSWADKAHHKVKAELQMTLTAFRGPGFHGSSVTLPYFVALSEGERIFDKQVYTVQASFPQNTDQVSVTTPTVSMLFPATTATGADAYTISVGFQLTAAELATNRARQQP
jgi:hypothetical protein